MQRLEIKNLSVKVVGKTILKDFNLNVAAGEIHAIMGQNGSGKSTLVNTLLGHNKYEVKTGEILFNGVNINKLTTDERARLGIYLCMQHPYAVEGVTTAELLRTILSSNNEQFKLYEFIKDLEANANHLEIDMAMLHRSVNSGFSGGERKKNEILQCLMLKPKLIVLDEIDSGVDVDSLRVITKAIKNYLKENPDTSVIIITHYPHILNYLKPNYVHILENHHITNTGDIKLAHQIEKTGFREPVCIVKGKISND